MSINQTVKRIVREYLNAVQPAGIVYGSVVQESPLEVNIDQRFTLTADFLVIPEHVTQERVAMPHTHSYAGGMTDSALDDPIVIRRGLQAGDKLILLRAEGGRQYVVIGRQPS